MNLSWLQSLYLIPIDLLSGQMITMVLGLLLLLFRLPGEYGQEISHPTGILPVTGMTVLYPTHPSLSISLPILYTALILTLMRHTPKV